MADSPNHFAKRVAEFEQECARWRRAGEESPVVLLGDSLLEGYAAPKGWINRGISGDRLRRPHEDVFDRLGSARLHPSPSAIVILFGVNDLADAPSDTARHLIAYRFLLTHLKQLYPSARLVVLTLLPTCGPSSALNPAIAAFNDGLVDVASGQGAALWNLHERFVDRRTTKGRTALFAKDGLHLSARGYRELAAFFEERAPELAAETGGSSAPVTIDRWKVARAIVGSYGMACWDDRQAAETEEALIENHVLPEIDFLCRYANGGVSAFRDMYLGSRARFIAKNRDLWKGAEGGMKAIFDRDRALWLEAIHQSDPLGHASARFERVFAELGARLVAGTPKRVRLLFIGDCLLEEVELLLGGELICEGILADIDFVLSKNPSEQVRRIKELAGTKYDGVLYSPLTWEFDQEFRSFLQPGFRSRSVEQAEIESIWKRIDYRVRLLADTFECNIYVNNTAAIVRAQNDGVRILKSLVTHPQRDLVRRELSARIAKLVTEVNKASFHHIFVVDELGAVKGPQDDVSLGRFLYYSGAIHPTTLSRDVARQVSNYVAASRLVDKKVVVCDLDNTLWDGVIGEGLGVRHYKDRQGILGALKQRGVVLAILSKNDPANVKWDGGFLSEVDFVASEISWNPKLIGIKNIQSALNLKIKDFVFIDDRADERQMLAAELPELTTFDPCQERTWTLFETWATLLGEAEGDRTKLYHERAAREKVLGDGEGETQISDDMFMKLQLKIDIRRAAANDLKRVHELINRTNQWNLQGSRCTFAEVKAWHESPNHMIYTASVSDKFGDMGLICCAVAEVNEHGVNVPIFVLSCRVFGFGVETLVLEQLKKDARTHFGAPKVRGFVVETPHNKPCRTMYADHGFVEQGGVWVYTGGKASAPNPVWFTHAAEMSA